LEFVRADVGVVLPGRVAVIEAPAAASLAAAGVGLRDWPPHAPRPTTRLASTVASELVRAIIGRTVATAGRSQAFSAP
jgi:hypothetical protein